MINSEDAKVLRNIKNIDLQPLRVRFDITTLDMLISFLYKDSVLRTRKTLSNFSKLFKNLDPDCIKEIPDAEVRLDMEARLWII